MRPLTLAVLFSLLAATALAATPALNTPEVLLDRTFTTDVAPGSRMSAAAATNGSEFLVAWVDHREMFPTVRVARVSRIGDVIDPLGIVVARDFNRDTVRVSVGSDGQDYLLAYDCGSYQTPAVCTAVVTAEGVVMKSETRLAGTAPDVAWNGTEYLVAYRRLNFVTPPTPSLFAQRLTREANPTGSEITLGVGGAIAVASNGTDFYAAWTFDRVEGRVIRADGSLGPLGTVAPSIRSYGVGNVDIASNGAGYVVAWSEAADVPHVYARRVAVSGEPEGGAIIVAQDARGAFSPAVARDGDRYLIAYVVQGARPEISEIRSVHVTDSLELTDATAIVTESRPFEGPSVASNGQQSLIAWTGLGQIRIYPSFTRGVRTLTSSLRWQDSPVTSTSNEHDLVVWTELVGESQLRTLFVKRAFEDVPFGRVHDSDSPQRWPVISAGASPMIFWIERDPLTQNEKILGRRLQADARPFSGPPVFVGETSGYGFGVATIADTNYVVWVGADRQLLLTRVSTEAVVVDTTPIPIVTARTGNVVGVPAVATDGVNLFVVWAWPQGDPCPFLCPPSYFLEVARVTPNGVVAATASLDRTGTVIPAVVWNGSEYSVFWTLGFPQGLLGRRFDRQGRAIDPQPVVIDGRRRTDKLAIGWNGREYVEAGYIEESPALPAEILINRISRALRLTSTVSVHNTPEERRLPAVLLARPGRGDFVLYGKLIQEGPFLGTSRIVIRSLTPLPRSRPVRR
jgi:hypothetical protein